MSNLLDKSLVCQPNDDSGTNEFRLPAGQASVVATPTKGTLVQNFAGVGTGIISMSAVSASQPRIMPCGMVWGIDMMHQWSGYGDVDEVVSERLLFMGQSVCNIPVVLPFRIMMFPMDGAGSAGLRVAWKFERQSSFSKSANPEVVIRKLAGIIHGPTGFAPQDPTTVPCDLLYPIGSELIAGLQRPDVSGFGWRPNFLNVRKTVAADNLMVFVAQGGAIGGLPMFGLEPIPGGVSSKSFIVDPQWSGGVIIQNLDPAVDASTIALTWGKMDGGI